jgi:Ca2+-binding RTX toxin-like protein
MHISKLFFDSLEHRCLLTSTVTLMSGNLTVNNDGGGHNISLSYNPYTNYTFVKEDGIQIWSGLVSNAIYVYGNGGNDAIDASAVLNDEYRPVTLSGGDGNDSIVGGGSADLLQGGNGDDQIYGGYGDDSIDGGLGDDTLRGDHGGDNLYGGANIDTVEYGQAYGIRITIDGVKNDSDGQVGTDNVGTDLERVLGSPGPDSIVGSNSDNDLYGSGGNDTLRGNGGNDVLNGGADSDYLYGGDGGDELILDSLYSGLTVGNDRAYGEAGDDAFYGGYDGLSDTIDGGAGTEYYYLSSVEPEDTILNIENFI